MAFDKKKKHFSLFIRSNTLTKKNFFVILIWVKLTSIITGDLVLHRMEQAKWSSDSFCALISFLENSRFFFHP
jgi:hypothetical protein